MAPRYKPFINRELSWLEFNQRVLDQAADPEVPLLERLKFLAITGSNLDEFFMVRVGGLRYQEQRGHRKADPSGRTPSQQLASISARTKAMVTEQYRLLEEELSPRLQEADIVRLAPEDLDAEQHLFLERVFNDLLYPVITPMALDPDAEFPLLRKLTLHMAVRLAPREGSKTPRYAVFPLAPGVERVVRVPYRESYGYILIEDVVRMFMDVLFPGERIMESQPFRITRNADMAVQEDMAGDLMAGMLDVLDARQEGNCIRLELDQRATRRLRSYLQRALGLRSSDVYDVSGPIDLGYLWSLSGLQGFESLQDEAWPPLPPAWVDPKRPMMEIIGRRDILLHHPYEQFDSVVRFIEEAAADPQVLAIKQILYRVSPQSPIVRALTEAAEKGKYVTVIVELKARFDEARNIEQARTMEKAGVQVIYGIKGLKTHAKLCLVLRREDAGIKRYLHVGTGNYNESTAKIYGDISYLTCDEDLGTEASIFFNTITGYSQPRAFHLLAAAPIELRDRLLELIKVEMDNKKLRKKAGIIIKVNSLADPMLIQALYKASQAGVDIHLNVRGICCLRPGLPGISETITVTSIVDRNLEHSRILYFYHGGEERLYIASADWMPRNLDRRVELMIPIRDKRCHKKLMGILRTYIDDTEKARVLMADGRYERIAVTGRRKRVRSQAVLYKEAVKASARAKPAPTFEPHRPSAAG